MVKKTLTILNLVVVLATIFLSYYSNTGAMNGNTMGSLSNEYSNLFTPASYAFSIWGLIYIGLIGNAIFLFRSKDESAIDQAKWLTFANLGNILWVYLWLYEHTFLSVLAMASILYSLIRLTLEIKIGFKKLPFWAWWPISIYTGWIVVALVANISAFMAKMEWVWFMPESSWAITIMVVSFVVYLLLLLKRRLAYASYVGVWAFAAIAVEHWNEIPFLQWTAASLALILFVLTVGKDYDIRMALKESTPRATSN